LVEISGDRPRQPSRVSRTLAQIFCLSSHCDWYERDILLQFVQQISLSVLNED